MKSLLSLQKSFLSLISNQYLKQHLQLLAFVCVTSTFFFVNSALAYYTTMDTADLPAQGKYNITAQSQFVTDGDSGINLLGHFDGRLTEDSSFRVEGGFGVTDLQAAAYYKWAPIPDTESQPAIAVLGGLSFARNNNVNDLSLRIVPITSKKFEVELGDITPYAALPISLQSIDSHTYVPIQLVLGGNLKTNNFQKVSFMGEVGLDLKDAFTYFSVGVLIQYDPEQGFKFE